ncbi:MAG: hypothetical protein IKA88_02340 [Clostridia bacterium]|nr:hypothetical protein [Clostridia bacterium]
MKKKNVKKIVFVCTGNTCRSPMAEMLLKSRLESMQLFGFEVYSAGIAAKKGDTMNPLSEKVLTENGVKTEGFMSTLLTDEILTEAFAVVCMTEKQRDLLLDMRWNALRKTGADEIENNVYSFAELTGYEVLDPYGRDLECYRYVFGLLEAGMNAVVEKLRLRELSEKTKTEKPKAEKPKAATPRKRTSTAKKPTSTKKTAAKKPAAANKSTAKKPAAKRASAAGKKKAAPSKKKDV